MEKAQSYILASDPVMECVGGDTEWTGSRPEEDQARHKATIPFFPLPPLPADFSLLFLLSRNITICIRQHDIQAQALYDALAKAMAPLAGNISM